MLGMGLGSSLGVIGAASGSGGISPRGRGGSNVAEVLRKAHNELKIVRKERDALSAALAKAQSVIAKLARENAALKQGLSNSQHQSGKGGGGSARARSASPPPRRSFGAASGFDSPQPQSMMGSFASMMGFSPPPSSPPARGAASVSPIKSTMDWLSGNEGIPQTGDKKEIAALRRKIKMMHQQAKEVGSGWSSLTYKALRMAEQYRTVAHSSTSSLHASLMSATKDKQGAQAAMHSLKGIAANNGKLMLQLAKIEDVNKVKAQVATWERGVKAIGA